MRRLTKRARGLLIGGLALAAGIALSLPSMNASAETRQSLTAAQITDGVLFNDGPAAVYLSNIPRGTIRWTPELRSVQAGIQAAVAADSTSYFTSDFARDMQSGDPQRVQSGLLRLEGVTHTYLEGRYGKDEVEAAARKLGARLNGGAQPLEPKQDLDEPVLVIAIVVIIFVWIPPVVAPDKPDDAALTREKFINDIALDLRLA
jgi:hypothetical protein